MYFFNTRGNTVQSLFEALPFLAAYKLAFMALCMVALITLIQNVLTAPLAFVSEEQVPGMPLRFDHSKLSFRVLRTYSNSAEGLPAFGFSVLIGIVAGASAFWVNTLAIVFLMSRLAFWAIYYSGVGKVAGGPRTMSFVVGLVSNTMLVIFALVAIVRS